MQMRFKKIMLELYCWKQLNENYSWECYEMVKKLKVHDKQGQIRLLFCSNKFELEMGRYHVHNRYGLPIPILDTMTG